MNRLNPFDRLVQNLSPKNRDRLEWLCATPPAVILFLALSFLEP